MKTILTPKDGEDYKALQARFASEKGSKEIMWRNAFWMVVTDNDVTKFVQTRPAAGIDGYYGNTTTKG